MIKKFPKISVIIPLQKINDYIHESIQHIILQKYPDFEIIILPDFLPEKNPFGRKVRLIPTGKMLPAEKRDLGANYAKGKVLAFIDDDAYPANELWLSRAAEYFSDASNIGAVGGPSLTPSQDGTLQVVCGEVLASWLFSGSASKRYKKGKKGEYHDLPSCNLFVSRKVFHEIGGFNSPFWPGEDTKLCADIIRHQKKIIYDPEITVYHHRRKGLKNYIRQTFRFGMHRGYFMKILPYTSLRLVYFIPPLFILWLFLGLLTGLIYPFFIQIYIGILLLYISLILIESAKSKYISTIPLFLFIGFLTHLMYGIGIIVGLIKLNLRSKLKPKNEI